MLAFLFSFSAWGKSRTKPTEYDKLDGCSWLVNYRGRTYDLAPLTRDPLARTIEGDLRHVLRRVPESEKLLGSMTQNLEAARGHTYLASGFLGGFLLSRIIASKQKNSDDKNEFRTISLVAAAFAVKAGIESLIATMDAKEDLADAVAAFNLVSPQKIEPASGDVKIRRNNA